MTYKFIEMVEVEAQGSTRRFDVLNKNHGDFLGKIAWYGAWRQYVFWPQSACVFSNGCLVDVASFITELMNERKSAHKHIARIGE